MNERIITTTLKAKHDNLGDIFASQVKIGPAGSKIWRKDTSSYRRIYGECKTNNSKNKRVGRKGNSK